MSPAVLSTLSFPSLFFPPLKTLLSSGSKRRSICLHGAGCFGSPARSAIPLVLWALRALPGEQRGSACAGLLWREGGPDPSGRATGPLHGNVCLTLFIPVRVVDKIGGDTRSVLVKFRTLA